MIRYFDRDGKHNFVDDNNAVVGYDSRQDCCENAGWYVSDSPDYDDSRVGSTKDTEWASLSFDPDFFTTGRSPSLDEGEWACFRMIGDDTKYLFISNSHNGFYGHGFTFTVGGEVEREGYL